jgi:hypothetical protein
MAANIFVYCPAGADGLDRDALEDELDAFFSAAAEDCGAGAGITGFNLDYELAAGEDPHAWADRLKAFLAKIGVLRGTKFDVFPDGWEPGMEWRRVEVFGDDRRRTDRPGPARLGGDPTNSGTGA